MMLLWLLVLCMQDTACVVDCAIAVDADAVDVDAVYVVNVCNCSKCRYKSI